MTDLAQLQLEFAEHLRSGAQAIADRIVGTARVDCATRLNIYSEAYRLRLLEALHTDYPGLRAALGDDAFAALGTTYIAAYPSQYYSLRHFGGHMGSLLRETPAYCDRPWLAELAEFEWALAAVFDAADVQLYTLEAAAALDPQAWPELRLGFTPALQRLECSWNVAPFRQAVTDAQALPEWTRSDPPVPWLLWRKDLRVYFRSLEQSEARALDVALAGETFSAICVALCEFLPESAVPVRAAGLFRSWIEAGILADVAGGSLPG